MFDIKIQFYNQILNTLQNFRYSRCTKIRSLHLASLNLSEQIKDIYAFNQIFKMTVKIPFHKNIHLTNQISDFEFMAYKLRDYLGNLNVPLS